MFQNILRVILVFFVIIILYAYWIWTSPPSINIPIQGTYISQEVKVSCASVACHYYRGYTTQTNEEEAVKLFIENNWNCKELRSAQDLGHFQLRKPYWECEGSAFPRGWVFVGIDPGYTTGDGVDLNVYVFWGT
jgi:hypothetical protein